MSDKHAAGVLVTNSLGQILCVPRGDGKMGLPAGKREPGEDSALTAVRECFEETCYPVVLRGSPLVVETDDGYTFVCYRAELAGKSSLGNLNRFLHPKEFFERCPWPEVTTKIFNHFKINMES